MHKHDIHKDIVSYVDTICTITNSYNAKLSSLPVIDSSGEESAKISMLAIVSETANAAFVAAEGFESIIEPETNTILMPGVDSNIWTEIRSTLSKSFKDVNLEAEKASRLLLETDSSSSIADRIEKSNYIVSHAQEELSKTIKDSLSLLPIPNSETSIAIQELVSCGPI
ncbi:hypothetical protein [Rhodococcus sp. BH5]|uniref:hypothetical protein n=1 Tax=Rhodococcus sp. BH5 TaxID=2871702 RepID=UPI0022CD22BF|nr:hypothetical protein [Rhodococcus sp. BH5]MCZ9635189.1 hypothetical protein [Rhodococcus sp. BH5]